MLVLILLFIAGWAFMASNLLILICAVLALLCVLF